MSDVPVAANTAFPLASSGPLRLRPASLFALCLAINCAVFIVDLQSPPEYALVPLYLVAPLLASWLPERRLTLGLAVLSTVLLVLGYVLSPHSPAFGTTVTLFNHGVSMLLLWLSAALAISHQASRRALQRSEQDLRAKEARLRSILDTAPEAIVTIDEHGLIESFSRSAEALFGYSAAEVVGRNVSVLMPPLYQEVLDSYIDHYRRTGERRVIGVGRVVSAQRKDGTIFPTELAIGEAIVAGHRLFTGFIRDLTNRQRIEQELRQAQKMEAVGQLTGGIAHDFNNLLTVILADLEMLEGRISDPGQLVMVKEARETAEHGARLTERLLAFARRQTLNPKLVDVGQLVSEFTELLRRALGETIEITMTAAGRLMVHVDPSQFQNAILNLSINARDAMPNGGDLAIDVAAAELDADYAQMHPEVRPGRYVVISLTDNGSGMSKEVRERAFEPFFTTKPLGTGTGLGLSMVYGFVKQSGGHAQIYSEEGFGTTVRLYLPLPADADEFGKARHHEPTAELRAHGELVLVVEDDPRVRRVTVARLKELGYEILEAENSPQAINLLDRNPQVDLLFTDIIMPGGMTGADLAREVRAKKPDMKVLFTSGYAEPDVLKKEQIDEAEWLKKPYRAIDLARKLREMLDDD